MRDLPKHCGMAKSPALVHLSPLTVELAARRPQLIAKYEASDGQHYDHSAAHNFRPGYILSPGLNGLQLDGAGRPLSVERLQVVQKFGRVLVALFAFALQAFAHNPAEILAESRLVVIGDGSGSLLGAPIRLANALSARIRHLSREQFV